MRNAQPWQMLLDISLYKAHFELFFSDLSTAFRALSLSFALYLHQCFFIYRESSLRLFEYILCVYYKHLQVNNEYASRI